MNSDYEQLITSAIKGDNKALEQIIKHEQNNIRLTLQYLKKDSNDINDIVQEILFKMSNKISHLKSPQVFKSWLNQIVINTFYDYLRKKKKSVNTIGIDNPLVENIKDDEKLNPQNYIINRELDKIIKNTIINLPSRYKIPITLRELSGLSYNEISNITNTTLGTVKSRIARARTMIKDELKKYDSNI